MRSSQRLISLAVLIALSGALAGCSGMSNFDPTDLLDFLDTKKKLPGDRKPVFPEGVPGLQQGVPRELYKGSVEQQTNAGSVVASAPPAQEQPKEPSKGRKSRAKPANVSVGPVQDAAPATPADPDAAPVEEGSTAAAPPAPRKKIVRRRTTAPPADADAAQPAPQAQSAPPATSAFPAPLPGTFQR